MPRLADIPGIAALLGRLTVGHILNPRVRYTVRERIDAIPTEGAPVSKPISIRWNENLVPAIQADNERDLAVGLGITHAHLRLGQLEFLKYISQGRASELVGPIANEVDHTLRVLNLGKASRATYTAMPESTKQWMQGYADGINYVVSNVCEDKAFWPEEFQILNIKPTHWTVIELLTLAKLNCADFTWGMWPKLLPLRSRKDWKSVWRHLMKFGGGPPVPADSTLSEADALAWLSSTFGKPGGSNAVAVSGRRTPEGMPIVSGDPHLPMVLPNFWIMGSLHCPTLNVVGFMLPGLPVVMAGRTEHMAWGATSMHAASSDLFDVTIHDESSFIKREELIKTRWGKDRTVILSDTSCGPLLTDAPMFNKSKVNPTGSKLAFRWVGHLVSDEITAMLNAARAVDFKEFQAAIKDFAVAGQNMVYGDTQGNIAQLMAARLPKRPKERPDDIVLPESDHIYWDELVDTMGLPMELNPERGYTASSNNRPEGGSDVLVSSFFSPNDRVERQHAILDAATTIDRQTLFGIMTDVKSDSAIALIKLILPLLDDDLSPTVDVIRSWDGEYGEGSEGALAFELLINHFAIALHGIADMEVMTVSWDPRSLLEADLLHVPSDKLRAALRIAIAKTEPGLKKFGDWGSVHRLKINHPLAALPIIGRRWRFGGGPIAGANETLMKSAHGLASVEHYVGMSSTARYLFDLSDEDANFVAMLGGQDGCPGSEAFVDQVELWNRCRTIQLPLRQSSRADSYAYSIVVHPHSQ